MFKKNTQHLTYRVLLVMFLLSLLKKSMKHHVEAFALHALLSPSPHTHRGHMFICLMHDKRRMTAKSCPQSLHLGQEQPQRNSNQREVLIGVSHF